MKFTRLFLFAAVLLLAVSTVSFASDPAAILLDQTVQRISAVFANLDKTLSETAKKLGKAPDPRIDMRAEIRSLCADKPYAIDCSFLNAQGVIQLVEPQQFRKFEGTSLASQAVTAHIINTKKPVLTDLFTGVEDRQAVVASYPVFNKNKEYVGSTGVFFTPEVLIQKAIEGLPLGKGVQIDVLQRDGTSVFALDPAQRRKNILRDPEYSGFSELRDLGARIVKEPEGTGRYRYLIPGGQQVARKRALWKTVTLYDNFWRVVVTQEETAEQKR
ncbi:MAG: hypothetical protein A4E57_03086 [Syntrophorhabdaceae bacterium PtaU1.Bin034]|nr:MAG: hypothetical protein A4E57_03086 [Syntrophorhabdaceae bacterium PtaU1.Bin034]